MTEATTVHTESAPEQTPLHMRLRWAFHRARRATLPRRWVIRREMRENSRYYTAKIEAARACNASRDEIEGLRSEDAQEYWMLEEELAMLESTRLIHKADMLMLSKPEFLARDDDPNWRRGTHFKPTWFLQAQAMEALRAKIRAERKARLEPIAEWVKIVGASAGGLAGVIFLVEKMIGWLR